MGTGTQAPMHGAEYVELLKPYTGTGQGHICDVCYLYVNDFKVGRISSLIHMHMWVSCFLLL